jgi:uncharacterized protein YjbJ (UPF0337 family)
LTIQGLSWNDRPVTRTETDFVEQSPVLVRVTHPRQRELSPMGIVDKAKNKAQKVKGHAKEAAGDHTNDSSLKAKGKKDQAAGSAKGTGEKIKDAL